MQVSMVIPLREETQIDTWEVFNSFRMTLPASISLGVCLEIKPNLPNENILDRWKGEHVRSMIFSVNCFTKNHKGFPILTKPHEALFKGFMKFKVSPIIKSNCIDDDLTEHRNYLCYLFKK